MEPEKNPQFGQLSSKLNETDRKFFQKENQFWCTLMNRDRDVWFVCFCICLLWSIEFGYTHTLTQKEEEEETNLFFLPPQTKKFERKETNWLTRACLVLVDTCCHRPRGKGEEARNWPNIWHPTMKG